MAVQVWYSYSARSIKIRLLHGAYLALLPHMGQSLPQIRHSKSLACDRAIMSEAQMTDEPHLAMSSTWWHYTCC